MTCFTKKCKLVATLIGGIACLYASPLFAQFHKKNEDAAKKKVKIAAIPMINYNRSYGFMYGAMASGYYRMAVRDTISPSSSTMLMTMYSTSHTLVVMGVQKFFLNEDRWRIKIIAGFGDLFYQYFQDLPNFPPPLGQYWDGGKWIDFETNMTFLVVDPKRKVYPGLYVGPLITANWAETVFDVNNPITGEKPSTTANMISLGYGITYDTRDNVNYPVNGFYVDFKNRFNSEKFGGSQNFTQFELAANHFLDIYKNGRSILVSRIHLYAATGDVPFQGQSYMGRDDLRGYSQGEYRGNQVYDAQVEWRQMLPNRFGLVGFVGVGKVLDDLSDFGSAEWLPGGGIGVRYRMIESEKVNIGIDAGIGKDDWSLTFRIGEAFGR